MLAFRKKNELVKMYIIIIIYIVITLIMLLANTRKCVYTGGEFV